MVLSPYVNYTWDSRYFPTAKYHSGQNVGAQDVSHIITNTIPLQLHANLGSVQSRVFGALEVTEDKWERTRLLVVPEDPGDSAASKDRLKGGSGSLVQIRDDPDGLQDQLHVDRLEERPVGWPAIQ